MIKMQHTTRKDIQDLLELLNTSNDIEIQAKIFSLFGCYLVSSNSTHRDLIITSHFVYDKIYCMLTKGLPKKVTVSLNFVTALLFEAEEEACTTKQSLVLHARNMLRVSGCLALMANLFNSCMVHQETWTALCRCLSEVCKHSQNQTYSADLIPTAIRRCSTGDIESYQVLQSLLQNHDRNTQQFIECNGLTIFTRDKLHNISCLKLVNVVAQNSKAVLLLVHKTEVVEIMRNFLDTYGKDFQIGQWATIILYHIKSYIKDLEEQPKGNKIKADYRFCVINENSFNNKISDGDTTELFQNVFKEILHSQRRDGNLYDTAPRVRTYDNDRNAAGKYVYNIKNVESQTSPSNTIFLRSENVWANCNKLAQQSRHTNNKPSGIAPKNNRGELSFSFLIDKSIKRDTNSRNQPLFSTVSVQSEKSVYVSNTTANIKKLEQNEKYNKSYYNTTRLFENMNDCTTDRTIEFKPTIVSTPKRLSTKQRQLHSSIALKKDERKIQKERTSRDAFKHRRTAINEVKNKSFGGKFFSAINESCTMLVKTVKNIFTTKNIEDSTATKENKSSLDKRITNAPHTNYSFMEYMRRRDAIMGSQCRDRSAERKSGSSCETCNNTFLLKRKLEKDINLKQTIKKLKFGINLYGCDFKKIAATMWPRDSYMTPTVLYNLYRKLIVK